MNVPTQRNKNVEALSRIIQDTQEGKVFWKVLEDIPDGLDTRAGDRVSQVFEAFYRAMTLRIYEKSYEASPSVFDNLIGVPGHSGPYWQREVVLEVISTNGVITQPFAKIGALGDLLSAVKLKVSGVSDFINQLANESRDPDAH